jgi:hypothetical protein
MLLPSVIGIDKAACSIEFVTCVLASTAIDIQAAIDYIENKRESL